MKNFFEVTSNENAQEYINNLKSKALLIYSQTSKEKLELVFDKLNLITIDTHSITQSIENIESFILEKDFKITIGIGGGTACDIAKYISYKTNTECVNIPTMLSTNVYSTDKVALLTDGIKNTLMAKLPDKIILDMELLKKSTFQNLYGFADILSIHTALYDWQISIKENNELIDIEAYNLAFQLLNEVKRFILNNDFDFIISNTGKLFYYIGQAGNITNIYGSGKPESGSEHIFTKSLESIVNIPHGIAVSIGIILMSLLQDNFDIDIVNCINKLKMLDDVKKYRITRDIIKNVLMNLKPRKDRYSIINKLNKDNQSIDKVIDKFEKLSKVVFYANNK